MKLYLQLFGSERMLGYADKDNITIAELTYSYEVAQFSESNAYESILGNPN
jgi:hypothetical protein